MPSPYSYSGPMPFQLDVWEPVGGRTPPKESEADPMATTPREALTAEAFKLLARLPSNLKLKATAECYPHVVNKLAILWSDATALDAFINSLLVDDRPERVGFHFEALAELIEIQQVRMATLKARESARRL
jgi:hypothetical protein